MKNTAKRLSALILALSVVTSGATARCAEPSVIVEKVDTSSEMLVDSGALVGSSKEPAQNEAGAFVVEKTEGGDLSIESAAPTEPVEPADGSAEEPVEFPEEDVPALNDIETTQVAEADGCVVTAVIPAFTLPVDATLVVSALDGAAVGSDVEKVEGALDAGEEIAFVRVFDIRFVTASGEEIEPGDTVAITIELGGNELEACDDVRVFCTDEPAAEEVGTVVTDGGVEFDAPHFSTYAVVGTYALTPVDDSAYDLKTSTSAGICQVENESFTNTNVASIEFVSDPSFDPATDAQGAYYGPVDVSANGSGMVYAYSVANGGLYDLHFVTLGSKVNLTNCKSENSPFYNLKNASYIAGVPLLDTSKVTDMFSMFYNCESLTGLDLSSFNTSKVTRMSLMFSGCFSLANLDLSSFNTSSVTDMSNMFYYCNSLTGLDLSSFNTSSVTDMSNMFYSCDSLTGLDLSSFNTSSVTNMNRMFMYCEGLKSLDLSSFSTESLLDVSEMFRNCSRLVSLDMSSFDLTALSAYDRMFYNLKRLENFTTPAVNPHEIPLSKIMYITSGTSAQEETGASTFALQRSSRALSASTFALSSGAEVTTLPVTTGGPAFLSAEATVSTLLYGTNFGDAIDQICAPKASEDAPINGGRTNSNVKTITFAFEDSEAGVSVDKVHGVQVDSEGCTYAVNDGNGNILVVTEASVLKPNADATGLFKNLSGLTAVKGLDLLDMSGVWSAACMFEGCKSLASADLSSFASATVVNTWGMFDGCSALSAVDVSPLGLQNSEQLACMFRNCSSLESVDLSSAPTIRSSSTEEMFANCTSLKTVTFANGVDTSAVTWMKSTFSGCTSLTSIENLASFNTSNVTSMATMFYNCGALTSLDISSFDTSKVTDMNQMFAQCTSLQTIDVSNLNTDSVTNMYSMFYNCQSVTDIDLSNAHKLAYTSGMFYNCAALQSITFANSIDTSNLTNMGDMFSGCSSLKRLDLSAFDTSNVENIWSFLSGCSSLEYLDLSSFDFSKVTATGTPFWGTTSIKIMKTPKKSQLSGVALGKALLNTSTKEMSSVLPVTNGESITLVKSGLEDLALKPSTYKNSKYYMFGFEEDCFDKHNVDVIEFCKMTKAEVQALAADGSHVVRDASLNNSGMVYAIAGPPEVVDGAEANVIRVATTEGAVFSCFNGAAYSSPFFNCIKLKDIRGLDLFYTGEETSFDNFFCNCKALKELDLSSFDTSKVTDMGYMFNGCSSLASLDLSNFNTSSVTDMSGMFSGCSSLTGLDLSSFDTSKIMYTFYMFSRCSSLTDLSLLSFDTSKVINMSGMFNDCSSLASLDLSSFDTSSVCDMSYMFHNCSSLTGLDLSSFDTSSVTDMSNMFSGCSSLKYVNSIFKTYHSENISYMFYGCSSLEEIDMSLMELGNLESGGYTNVFGGTTSLRKLVTPHSIPDPSTAPIELSKTMLLVSDFSPVTTLPGECSMLVSEDYAEEWALGCTLKDSCTNGETSSSKIQYYFCGVREDAFMKSNIESVSFWEIPMSFNLYINHNEYPESVAMLSYVLKNNYELVDVSANGQSKLTIDSRPRIGEGLFAASVPSETTAGMYNIHVFAIEGTVFLGDCLYGYTSPFDNLTAAKEILGLDKLNTSRCTSMSGLFDDCKLVQSLNISNFDTSKVTDMSWMFSGCRSLTSLDVSGLDTSSVLNTSNMFASVVPKPVGVEALDVSKVTNMSFMFCNVGSKAAPWEALDLSGYNTASATNMERMFCGARVRTLDVSSFDTSKVTNMTGMFDGAGTTYLQELDVSNFDTSAVTDASYMFGDLNGVKKIVLGPNFALPKAKSLSGMFEYDYALEELDVSCIKAPNATSMSDMFVECKALKQIDLSNCDTSKVTSMSYMFNGCTALESVNLSGFNTQNVTSVAKMFYKCSSLSSVDLSDFEITTKMYNNSGSWGSVFDGSGVKEIILPKRAERSVPLPKTFQLCNSENEITGGGTAVLSAATPAYTKALDVQPAIVTFVVPKKIEIGADGVAEYTAKVCAEQTGNLSAAAEATVAPAAQVVMSQEGKADVALDISQAAGSFNLRDTSVLEGGVAQSQGRIDASGLSAGVWRGSFDFTLGLRNMTYSP